VSSTRKLPREFVERVEALAADPALDFLLDMLVEKYSEEWRTTPPDRADRRDHLYHMVKATEGLRSEVRSIASSEAIEVYNRGLQNKTKWSNI
jgi:hypothetical protein